MKNILYGCVVGSLLYAQICMRSDISFVVRILDKYQSNLGMKYWKAAKIVMRYPQGDERLYAYIQEIRSA